MGQGRSKPRWRRGARGARLLPPLADTHERASVDDAPSPKPEGYDVHARLRALWDAERAALKAKLEVGTPLPAPIRTVVGCDVSYLPRDGTQACATLCVYDVLTRRAVHFSSRSVRVRTPYIPGYLGFKEAPLLAAMVAELPPKLRVDALMVDGNGVLHPDGFGSASHLGVLTGLPTVGVAKALHCFPGMPTERAVRQRMAAAGNAATTPIRREGAVDAAPLGVAVVAAKGVKRPVYVSVGHRIALDAAVALVQATAVHRVPEPIRHADIKSRQILRESQLMKAGGRR